MTAFGVTNASAEPVSSARASAFGIELSLLGEELIEREPEVTSEFPPGGSEEEDVVTIDGEELVLEGVGIQQAETAGESTITPALVSDGEEDGGGSGGILQTQQLGGGGEEEDLLGGLGLDELFGGDDGGGDEGDGSVGGIGGPDDDDIDLTAVNARGFSSISLTGLLIDEDGDGQADESNNLFDDLTGGLTGGEEEASSSDSSDITEDLPVVGTESAGKPGTVQIQQEGGDDILGDLLGSGVTGDELQQIIFDALLRLGVIESEAVATCVGGQVRVDVASRIVDDQGSDIEIGDILDDVISEVLDITDELAPELIRTIEGEVVEVPGGVGINALHIIVGEDLGGDLLGGGEGGEGGDIIGDITGGGDDGGDSGGEDEPLLDIVLAHSEVSNNVCAQQAAPPAPAPLPPSGDRGTLPVTGGGIGILPAVLGLGLAGGAVGAGRLALRSRKESI